MSENALKVKAIAEPLDLLKLSREFMFSDLARSGLSAKDFPTPPEPLLPVDGCARYRIHYNENYHKDRINRPEDKYIGMAKVIPPVVFLGNFSTAKITAGVEGYKKALKFFLTTGIPTLVLDSCHGWGEKVHDTDSLAIITELRADIVNALPDDAPHIVLMDGDWSSNPQVGTALATYTLALESNNIRVTALDLGVGSTGTRLGYDDWFIEKYGTVSSFWPAPEKVQGALFDLQKIPVMELDVAKSYARSTVDRLGKNLIDLTDRGTGSLVIRLLGKDNIKYLEDAKRWVRWIDGRWENIGKEPLSLIDVAAKHYFDRVEVLTGQLKALKDAEQGSSDKYKELANQRRLIQTWANSRCSSVTGRSQILKDIGQRQYMQARLSQFDADPDLLGVANGVLDLRTGELRAHRQQDYILKRCPAAYPGSEPTGPSATRIKDFLIQITGKAHKTPDPERLLWLQYRVGASLRGSCALSALEIWHGEGSNGKSVLAKLIEGALGKVADNGYCAALDAAVIMATFKQRDAESSTPFRMTLVGARYAFLSESADTAHLNEAALKLLTGGDTVSGRRNYGDPTDIDMTATFVLLTNPLPNIAEGGKALWDRISPFKFLCRWRRPNLVTVAEEERDLPLGDLWFLQDACKDAEAQAYILWWVTQGSIRWEQNGRKSLPAPADVVETLNDYMEKQDLYSDWMFDQDWLFDSYGHVTYSALYGNFKQWMDENGKKAPANNIFSKRLIERFPSKLEIAKSNGVRIIRGIRKGDRVGLKATPENK